MRACAALLLWTFLLSSHAVYGDGNPGQLIWSAIECSTFAEMAGDESEHKRLFDIGYTTGKQLLDRWNDLDDQFIQSLPIGILMSLEGPSNDFMLGRIFSLVSNTAFDKVTRDSSGSRISDKDVKTLKAQNLYRSSNCELIR